MLCNTAFICDQSEQTTFAASPKQVHVGNAAVEAMHAVGVATLTCRPTVPISFPLGRTAPGSGTNSAASNSAPNPELAHTFSHFFGWIIRTDILHSFQNAVDGHQCGEK